MTKAKKILGIIALIALILKLTLVPGGAILLTLSLSALTCLYYILGFALFNHIKFTEIFKKKSYEGVAILKILGGIGIGILLSINCTGILFKLQNWEGSNAMIKSGCILIFIVSILVSILYFKNKNEFYARILKRTIIIGGVGLVLCFL